ncbi:hypothetical protein ACHAXH_003942 [Discostella pseudostelligera]
MPEALPNISSMKLTQLREELNLYGINSSTFCEKSEMIAALQHARDTLPRPTTSYREVEPPPPPPSRDEEEKKRFRATRRNSITKPSPFSTPSSSSGGSSHSTMPQAAAATATSSTATNSHPPPPSQSTSSSSTTTQKDAKKALALRSPVVIHQRIKEKPTSTITTPSSFATPTTIGERSNSFLPGSPFSFAIHGSIYDDDAAILRIPDGICLTINSASVDAKSMEVYLHQKGALGVSLKLSSEENPQLLPVWTFDKEKSSSYNISNLGIRVAGPRNIRLGACMEMGYRSGASVDVFVFGSVTLDSDKF